MANNIGTKISVTKAQRELKRQAKTTKKVTITQLKPTILGKYSVAASALKKRRYDAEEPF